VYLPSTERFSVTEIRYTSCVPYPVEIVESIRGFNVIIRSASFKPSSCLSDDTRPTIASLYVKGKSFPFFRVPEDRAQGPGVRALGEHESKARGFSQAVLMVSPPQAA